MIQETENSQSIYILSDVKTSLKSTCDFNLTIASVLFRPSKLQTYLQPNFKLTGSERFILTPSKNKDIYVCVDYHFNIAAHFYSCVSK